MADESPIRQHKERFPYDQVQLEFFRVAREFSKRLAQFVYTECSYENPCAYCRGEKEV